MANKTPQFDAKMKEILDTLKSGERKCEITGKKWNLVQEEIKQYYKFNVPVIEMDPNTRWAYLGFFSTGFQFWWNKHFETGDPVLTYHHPASGIKVIPDKEWYDKDFSKINLGFDSGRSVFDHIRELQLKIPYPASGSIVPPENSIALVSFGDKNSYFVLGCQTINSFYCTVALDAEDCSLIFTGKHTSKSHHVLESERIFNSKYISVSHDCMDSVFLFDCRNCKNCFGATNKRNCEYIFFNEQLTKEEYEQRVSQIDLGKRSVVKEYFEKWDNLLMNDTVWPENFNERTTDCTGDYLTDATRCYSCFSSVSGAVDNFQTCWSFGKSEEVSNSWAPKDSSRCHYCITTPGSSDCKFCFRCIQSENCEYCVMAVNCRDCFGCVGLQRKEFCIFNKQYSEEEYWLKMDEIKCKMLEDGEYGKYFPVSFSGTYVPESGPVIYSGLSPEELEKFGGNKFDVNAEGATGSERIDQSKMRRADEVPNSIDDLTDDWIGVPIMDEAAGRTFSFLKPEIEHYRRLRIAPPNNHFIRRMVDVSFAGQLCVLETHSCTKCDKEILTSCNKRYPDRKIYCKECYLKYLEQYG